MFRYFYVILICSSITTFAQKNAYYIALDSKFWTYFDSSYTPQVISSGHGFTEGPVWSGEGFLLFSDIPKNKIYKWHPDLGLSVFKEPSFNSNGLTFNYKNQLVICEQQLRQIKSIDKDNVQKVLASSYYGKKFNSPNDIVFRKDGTFYFTDPPYGLHQFNNNLKSDFTYSGVFMVTHSGQVSLIDSTLKRPNGITLSPDEKYLYVVQSEFDWIIKRYTLDAKGKVISDTLFSKNIVFTGNLDGIKTDKTGVIFATGNHGLVCISNEGLLLGYIVLPENTTNLCWGDSLYEALYITAQDKIYKIKTKTNGNITYLK